MLVYNDNISMLTLILGTVHKHTHHVLPLGVFSASEGNAGLLSLDNERTAVCRMLRTDLFAFFPPLSSATRDL